MAQLRPALVASLACLPLVATGLGDAALAAGGSGIDSGDQVTSIGQFSDLRPTDWAYQALGNLIER